MKSPPIVSVVSLTGMIAQGPRGLNGRGIAPVLERAFARGKPAAVALIVNSPGGSPVQSSLIGARIRRLAEEKDVPVYAFVEDVAASGGYWLAAAADEIWIDASSVVGSIGVISSSFGAHEFIERYGIERRVYTAGKSKSQLDPFRPEQKEDVERLRRMLDQIHETFIAHVKSRRTDKLGATEDLFNGEIWVGDKAVEIGLADGIGHIGPKMKEIFGDKVQFRRYAQRRPFLTRFGVRIVEDALAQIEERAAMARFGL